MKTALLVIYIMIGIGAAAGEYDRNKDLNRANLTMIAWPALIGALISRSAAHAP